MLVEPDITLVVQVYRLGVEVEVVLELLEVTHLLLRQVTQVTAAAVFHLLFLVLLLPTQVVVAVVRSQTDMVDILLALVAQVGVVLGVEIL
jgi:hypothetical protein